MLTNASGAITLYLESTGAFASGSIPLFINGIFTDSLYNLSLNDLYNLSLGELNSLPLASGENLIFNSFGLFIAGSPFVTGLNLYINGFDTGNVDNGLNLYLEADYNSIQNGFPLSILGSGGRWAFSNNFPLYINGSGTYNNSVPIHSGINLYVCNNGVSNNFSLYTHGKTTASGYINLYTFGVSGVINNHFSLYTNGINEIITNQPIPLFVRGFFVNEL